MGSYLSTNIVKPTDTPVTEPVAEPIKEEKPVVEETLLEKAIESVKLEEPN